MNYIERLLESQFANDELKDYLDKKHKKGNPKLSQKYKVAISGEKNKEVNRRAKGLQDAPNAHRFAVQLNSKLRFNNINALAQPDGKYRNLIWVLAAGNRLNLVFKYLNQFLELEPNNSNFEIGDYQIRIADVNKTGVQQYFIRQNGLEFMKTMDGLKQDNDDDNTQTFARKDDDKEIEIDSKYQDNNNKEQEELSSEQERYDREQLEHLKKTDEYRNDVVGYDSKHKKPIYKTGSKGWWKQRKDYAKEIGIDLSKMNFDPSTWKISRSLSKAS